MVGLRGTLVNRLLDVIRLAIFAALSDFFDCVEHNELLRAELGSLDSLFLRQVSLRQFDDLLEFVLFKSFVDVIIADDAQLPVFNACLQQLLQIVGTIGRET